MRRPPVWYSVQNIGPYAWVPTVVVGLLLPAGLLLARASANPQVASLYIRFSATLLAPAFAVWWPPFVFKERIEGDGRELLYFLKRKGQGLTALALALSYWVLLVPFVAVALGVPDFSVPLVAMLLARCLFLTAFAFCAAFVLHSSALALILALMLNMVAMMPLEGLADSLAPTVNLGEAPVAALLLYAVLATALLWLGEARSRGFAG